MYDDNGNLINRQEKSNGKITKYEYSSENQLKKLVEQDGLTGPILKEVRYFYDALGRRMEKRVIDNQNLSDVSKTFTRKYVYEGNETIAELNNSNNLLVRYTHSRLRTDDVLAADVTSAGVTAKIAQTAKSYFYLKDALGTITDIIDDNGDVLQRYNYSVFGKLVSVHDEVGSDITSTPVLATAFTFTGREIDSESELYYYRARYYDSSIGRFLQVDPHPGITGDPITMVNRYTYAGNAPTHHVDPYGDLFFLIPIVAGAVGAWAGTAAASALVAHLVLTGATAIVAGAVTGVIVGGLVGASLGGTLGGLEAQWTGNGSFAQGFADGAAAGGVAGAIGGGIGGGLLVTRKD